MIDGMTDPRARIAEMEAEVTALERSLAEILRRSKICTDAAAGNWGGRPVPAGEVQEQAPTGREGR